MSQTWHNLQLHIKEYTMQLTELQQIIEQAFTQRQELNPTTVSPEIKTAVEHTLSLLDSGERRVAEKINDEWIVHQWLKKAVLLSFKIQQNRLFEGGFSQFFDKVPLKFTDLGEKEFTRNGIRVVPPACARRGAYIAANTVLMPSYVNIGAYVDSGTLVDTWATVGSCAQIGKNVHLSGGAGIGGVLEPLQANPTIIEDNCFIGARSEIVEGVIVEKNAVIAMGVFIGQSTKIYNRMNDEITYGRIPEGAVVVPGSLPADNGKYNLNCAVIIKQVDAKTREKTSINELLR